MDWNLFWFIYKCNNRHEKTLGCHYKKRWQFLLAGIVIAQRFDTWDGHSRVLNMLHTYELSDVSTGEFIDTLSLSHSLLAGRTVNCWQHIEDLKAIGNSWCCNISLSLKLKVCNASTGTQWSFCGNQPMSRICILVKECCNRVESLEVLK